MSEDLNAATKLANLQRKFAVLDRPSTKEIEWLQFEVEMSRVVVATQRESIGLQRSVVRRTRGGLGEDASQEAELQQRRTQIDQLIELRRQVRSKIADARATERARKR
ncbi:MAG: hypothetical protein JO257_29840 [Deltaproteobacteria bacterium]|nr:hypothetical protein [Deltaproteobacteria bacterium]